MFDVVHPPCGPQASHISSLQFVPVQPVLHSVIGSDSVVVVGKQEVSQIKIPSRFSRTQELFVVGSNVILVRTGTPEESLHKAE